MRCFLVIILVFASIASVAQIVVDQKPEKNLIPNGSFENYRKKANDIRKAVPWRPIETIDYYHNPLKNDTTIQKGAYSGYCYTGFRFRRKYKEFLQVKLVESLHRGTIYEYSMHVRLAFWSNAILRSFGVLFTKGGYKGQSDVVKSNMIDTVCVKGGLMKGYQWFTIKGFYKADGGEKYITIGNFASIIKKDMVRIDVFRIGPKESYYFVDDIKLIRAPQFEEKIAVERVGPNYLEQWKDSTLQVKEDVKIGEAIGLNNISFVNGKYYLLPESYIELNKLAQYLLLNPRIEIQINGHSDNVGLKFRNQKVSELRAREVFEYLIKKGVQNKMLYRGFGSSFPIADNETEEGRIKNRRVEFEIIKK
ncbi:OmpA family protein [Aurantibacillus circumpalustris]|uniref:OmpA family protein n=1 Tax=Aurantibacillus circumpalustris TaxID=3036359 RepID=UPI00295BF4F9|nr:OmpA family protein [Aurantibacillus circumpalustris]